MSADSLFRTLRSRGAKVFHLVRDIDPSGTSGLGIVAEGCEFESGVCALSWLTRPTSIGIYGSADEMMIIHGHGGQTRLEYD